MIRCGFLYRQQPAKPERGETHGKDYYFETPSSFKTMIATGKMLEHAQVFGHYYGSPRAPVEHAIEQGYDVLFDVDWQGGQQIPSIRTVQRCRVGVYSASVYKSIGIAPTQPWAG